MCVTLLCKLNIRSRGTKTLVMQTEGVKGLRKLTNELPITAYYYEKQTPWPESANKLYRPIDLSLSAKLVPTFADKGCRVISVVDPYGRVVCFLDHSRYLFFQVAPQLYSHGLVDLVPGATGIEPGTLTTRPQMRSVVT
jgi:hypothetical protein